MLVCPPLTSTFWSFLHPASQQNWPKRVKSERLLQGSTWWVELCWVLHEVCDAEVLIPLWRRSAFSGEERVGHRWNSIAQADLSSLRCPSAQEPTVTSPNLSRVSSCSRTKPGTWVTYKSRPLGMMYESHHSISGISPSFSSFFGVIRANLVEVCIPVFRAAWDISACSFSSWAWEQGEERGT